jgi:hypothetical protein
VIESVEDYISLVEQSNRNAITERANEDVWISILESRPDLAADVAMNKQLPASILDRLIAGQCTRAKSLVAMKRALNDEQFRKLSIDEDESVRNMVANNKKTPVKILEQLLNDEFDIVSNAAKEQMQARFS